MPNERVSGIFKNLSCTALIREDAVKNFWGGLAIIQTLVLVNPTPKFTKSKFKLPLKNAQRELLRNESSTTSFRRSAALYLFCFHTPSSITSLPAFHYARGFYTPNRYRDIDNLYQQLNKDFTKRKFYMIFKFLVTNNLKF